MCTSQGQDATATVKKILPSLALIVATSTGPGAELGTGFCFWSTPSKSYFLTNRHVIEGAKEILVRPQQTSEFSQPKTFYKGRAYPVKGPYTDPINVRPPEEQDLRVVVVDVGNLPRVTLSEWNPDLGQSIGIAGFPSFQFEVAGAAENATPSVHFGSANSFPESHYIEFDAVADHGNSGGPLFDRRTGNVYGVVTLVVQSKTSQAVQNNLAIDANTVEVFLNDLRLPYVTYGQVMGFVNMEFCKPSGNVMADLRRSQIASLQADTWWCNLPDAPRQ